MAERRAENFIKFGPEWLRNFSREGSAGGTSNPSANKNQNPNNQSGNNSSMPKYQLADHRYGREEMLALYDKNYDAPPELTRRQILYMPNQQDPIALTHEIFEDDGRDMSRGGGGALIGGGGTAGGNPLDRYGSARGGLTNVGRGRGRLQYYRNQMTGPNRLLTGYTPGRGAEETQFQDAGAVAGGPTRSWSTLHSPNNNQNGGNDAEYHPRRRFLETLNWRRPAQAQTSAAGGVSAGSGPNAGLTRSFPEESEGGWRGSDNARPRPTSHQDKWGGNERDWGERGSRERPTSWNASRRGWNAEFSPDDHLPEWAVENSEPAAGSFDASGAFLGVTNDDSGVPYLTYNYTKNSPEAFFGLARSHTQGSFPSRSSKTDDFGEEWANSEKAKKLSKAPPMKLPNERNSKEDTAADKPARALTKSPSAEITGIPVTKSRSLTDQQSSRASSAKQDSAEKSPQMRKKPISPILRSKSYESADDRKKKVTFREDLEQSSKTFDALTRRNVNAEDASDERGNFQSVLITPNNSLRQRHQNLVTTREPMSNMAQEKLKEQQQHQQQNLNPPVQKSQQEETSIVKGLLESLQLRNDPNINKGHMGAGDTVNDPAMLRGNNNMMAGAVAGPSQHQPVNMYQMPGMQPQTTSSNVFGAQNFADINKETTSKKLEPKDVLWYYEDPQRQVQGPFTSKEMTQWYTAGFFDSNLMVRRENETTMRPLGTYGGFPPFLMERFRLDDSAPTPVSAPQPNSQLNSAAQISTSNTPKTAVMSSTFGMQQHDPRTQRNSMMSGQPDFSLNMQSMTNMPDPSLEAMRYGSVPSNFLMNQHLGQPPPPLPLRDPNPVITPLSQPQIMPESPHGQVKAFMNQLAGMAPPPQQNQNNVQSLWGGQTAGSAGYSWMPPVMLQDPGNIWLIPKPTIPDAIRREMKTEEQILEENNVRSALGLGPVSNSLQGLRTSEEVENIMGCSPPANLNKVINASEVPTLGGLDIVDDFNSNSASNITQPPHESQSNVQESQIYFPAKILTKSIEPEKPKLVKQQKIENIDKSVKNKDNNATKVKSKNNKTKEQLGNKDEEKFEKSEETPTSKNKKDDKLSKKELQKEMKEWAKEGFIVVKGAERSNKESKKKHDEAKALEEAERKRKEEEKQVEMVKIQSATKKEHLQQQEQLRGATSQAFAKKAPWSSIAHQASDDTNNDGLTLAEIQRLEREKKLEQMKEQQQMMHMIAQQQQAALAREQEMQAGFGWAKQNINKNQSTVTKTLAEIQAEEGRKQQMLQMAMEMPAVQPQTPTLQNHLPWSNTHSSEVPVSSNNFLGGFWDTEPVIQSHPKPVEKPIQPSPKAKEPKANKKAVSSASSTKEIITPVKEFENWCSNALNPWSGKVDVATFVGFLKDIESPYEIKDYVKCYLGETKDSTDFAKQFLEKRSKLLRIGMATPVDDLCVPAPAINPSSGNMDFQEGKGKKIKKNKMLKVDARILGFSVTASEDRINVGDIDTV